MVGIPSHLPPVEAAQALRAACRAHPQVARCYIFQTYRPDRPEPPHPVIGVRFDPRPADDSELRTIFAALAAPLTPTLPTSMPLDLVDLGDNGVFSHLETEDNWVYDRAHPHADPPLYRA